VAINNPKQDGPEKPSAPARGGFLALLALFRGGVFRCGLAALGIEQNASAQDVPRYGTEAHCQRVAAFNGTFSQSTYETCLNTEQAAALALQARWRSIPPSARDHRDRFAAYGGEGSYLVLQTCVDMETGRTRGAPPRRSSRGQRAD
jgi:hypothetical protein